MTHDEIAAAVADVIQEHVALSLAPVLARLAVAETKVDQMALQTHAIGDLRDRVIVVETKSAMPAPVVPDPAPDVYHEQFLATLAEIKADLLTAKLVSPPVGVSGPTAAETELAFRDRLDPVTTQLAAMSERVAVLEVRAPVPGPPGKDGVDGVSGVNGKDGKDGLSGKDGADGLGFDDLSVEFDGDRTLALTFERGSLKKTFPIALPYQKYQGLYQEGRAYVVGDTVTWAGHMWYCHADTVTKPGESKHWQQCVQRGREGKPGQDAR